MKLNYKEFKDYIFWLDEQRDVSANERLVLQSIAIINTYPELSEKVISLIKQNKYEDTKKVMIIDKIRI